MRFVLIVVTLIFSTNSFSGELTNEATVIELANHATGDGMNFAVKIENGIGPCTGWIYFFESSAVSPSTYNQAFSIALTAFAAGNPVRIHNFLNDSCAGAQFISIAK